MVFLTDITVHVKPYVDYLTFQSSRVILQFRYDEYIKTELRMEKLNEIFK